jgi:hypothetical protein
LHAEGVDEEPQRRVLVGDGDADNSDVAQHRSLPSLAGCVPDCHRQHAGAAAGQ